ncbi:MAG TPA: glutaredoxin family protein [Smithellaceae bacterium]|nr:glutaredoxin family protein [Smithellaceae bacterium]
MIKHILILFALIFALYGVANAEFYTWEDENGVVHITDYPPPQTKSAKKTPFRTHGSGNDLQEQSNAPAAQKKPDVIIFTKNECPDCDKARNYLKSKQVQFTEYNMDTDPTAAAKRKEYDDTTDVPFAIINRNHVFGFAESVYERVLKIKP